MAFIRFNILHRPSIIRLRYGSSSSKLTGTSQKMVVVTAIFRGGASLVTTRHNLLRYSTKLSFPLPSSLSLSHKPKFPAHNTYCTTSSQEEPVTTLTPPPAFTAINVDVDEIKEAGKLLDIRVGKIVKAWRHEEADSLYVEEVDVGESELRIICSGLVKYIPLDRLQGSKVVVLANLKPRNMRGVKSCGMLMAASDAAHENVELLVPSDHSVPGERIWFGLEDEKENQPDAASPNQIHKKKTWELVQPHLKTDSSCVAMLGEHVMRTSAGPVVSKSLKNANIS